MGTRPPCSWGKSPFGRMYPNVWVPRLTYGGFGLALEAWAKSDFAAEVAETRRMSRSLSVNTIRRCRRS